MIEKHSLTKQEFDNLFDLDVSVREKKEVQAKLGERFAYIIHKMADIIGRKVDWYDYDNEGGKFCPGYFDSSSYDTDIRYVGKFSSTQNEGFDKYEYSFPTFWLHQDFESQLMQEVKEYNIEEQKVQEQKNKDKERGNEIKTGILAKLSPEERCYVVFAKPEKVQEAQRILKKQEDKLLKKQSKALYKNK